MMGTPLDPHELQVGGEGHSPDPLRHLGAFLGQAMPNTTPTFMLRPDGPILRGQWDLIRIVLEEEAKKPPPTRY